ncbi:hypothetical protein ABIA32_006328 [Streptacidiphilus sp. MAP12-20]|uniref:hypothetical protein n=1 Tax=Streptacidiphilus sp. MAP12-20 TaxID=3156299 RepID=UPI0035128BE7
MRKILRRTAITATTTALAAGLAITGVSQAQARTDRPYDKWIGNNCRGSLWVEDPNQDYVQAFIGTLTPDEGGSASPWVQCYGQLKISHNYGRSWSTVWGHMTDSNMHWIISPVRWDGPGLRAEVCISERDWGYTTATKCTAMW